MTQLLGLLSPFGLGRTTASVVVDDDLTDRLNHTYTVMILVIISVIVSTKQYVGDPIQCWVPGHFTLNHQTYANTACWVSNTYYIPISEQIPKEGEHRQWINYYQWVPMILLAQAALFHTPLLVWRGCNNRIGIQIRHIVEVGRDLHNPDTREKNLRLMVHLVDRYLGHYWGISKGCMSRTRRLLARKCHSSGCGKKHGNYLAVLYLCVKFLYLANCLGQLFVMDVFLGTDFHFYGFHALWALVRQDEWPGSSRFPTFTICDYKVRQMGHNIHRNTVQCVLPINFFNEKLYLGLWLWFTMVSISTGISTLIWLMRISVPRERINFIKKHLRALRQNKSRPIGDRKFIPKFVCDYLRHDGVMLIRMVQYNTSDIVASELTAELYVHFRAKPVRNQSNHEDDESGDEEEGLVDNIPDTFSTSMNHGKGIGRRKTLEKMNLETV